MRWDHILPMQVILLVKNVKRCTGPLICAKLLSSSQLVFKFIIRTFWLAPKKQIQNNNARQKIALKHIELIYLECSRTKLSETHKNYQNHFFSEAFGYSTKMNGKASSKMLSKLFDKAKIIIKTFFFSEVIVRGKIT